MRRASRKSGRHLAGAIATVLALSLIAAACGGTTADDADGGGGEALSEMGLTAADGESGLEEAGEPQRGGTIVYGVEADSTGGYCLPEGQLAISGMLVVRAIYDTLTVPNAEGDYVPYLAKSIEPNETFDEWTIEVREGITFHDGSPLTGEVVKNNLDAYRGEYPGRNPLLFSFVLNNIESVEADGQTVTVTTEVPWVAFPAFLYSSSRLGIMAQAQLDDAETCATNPIGTGPFVFQEWNPQNNFKATRNESYWQIAPDGEPYPYADAIEFRVLTDNTVRMNSLESSGGANVIHTSNAENIGGNLRQMRDAGEINMFVSEDGGEVSFVQLNTTAPPFDDPRMREALAIGADRADINETQNDGLPTVADGPFAPDSIGYLEDPGFPQYDLERAKELVAEYVAEGGNPEFNLTSTSDPSVQRLAELIQQRAQETGVRVNIVLRDQAALINDAIGKGYQAMVFRNFPGGDPDINYVWWYGEGNPVNFSGYDDEVINGLLDEGRSEPDPDRRAEIYQDINRRFAEQVWSVWAWYTPWAIVLKPEVHNVLGPPLPGEDHTVPGDATTDDDARKPFTGLATAHSLIGLWIES